MPMRQVRHPDGCLWTVWDTYPESARRLNVMAGFEKGWLTFQREEEKHRLHPVPPGWDREPDAQLLRYLAAARAMQAQQRSSRT